MCEFCGRRHTPEACPHTACIYCNWCATYGHQPTTCRFKPDLKKTRPRIRAEPEPVQALQPPVFEITEDLRIMRAFLYSQELKTAGKLETLQNRICEWAGKNGYDTVKFIACT